ncbi:hypothetical protein BOSE62_71350 [Bosea sp. 62]|nr:hypothetical protein BOSE21B_90277 [Bosea sp. 21B]CAD5295303.1 hypothetical protein BOSE46_80374 [Bosea sp. 46]CAD5298493.1 hypothetical protein BOSE7B_60388 [Bosea sp. 7B]VVT60924.1 hypothetical protein BOS5A_230201 [Bosea sp. EC-HK365B]VXB36369.1 hypothetical protein BOSE127_110387 [Bosea sp. 127]VXB57560.1 hypothetical protein BOSE125_131121 [Bosea sp. 125]VXC76226.1 hypothetical protein BOSE29B_80264 [Bosea sp. 29B]VXC90425.1 hypothetical protein BOSE62_71350 [Bosea sp. 62]
MISTDLKVTAALLDCLSLAIQLNIEQSLILFFE